MADKAKVKSKKRRSTKKEPEQTYVHRESAVHITLYDTTGTPLSPVAKEEFEQAALHVAQQHPNVLLSVAVT